MKYNKEDLNWLMRFGETRSERFMEAERFLIEIAEMRWYQRICLARKILKFLSSQSAKYKF